MSRTDKDRPYWVILNDETIEMGCHHYHSYFGRDEINHWGKYKVFASHCTAYETYTWHSWDERYYLLPCVRYPLKDVLGWSSLSRKDRVIKHRRNRRDFLKKQVKIFNSNHVAHDDYEFMNDDVFEPFRGENSHSASQNQ